jgi:hypothetical protein
MAILRLKCEEVALGNVAAVFVVNRAPARSVKTLQSGGSHPTSTCSNLTKRLSI